MSISLCFSILTTFVSAQFVMISGVFISSKIKYFWLPIQPLFRRILEFITGQKICPRRFLDFNSHDSCCCCNDRLKTCWLPLVLLSYALSLDAALKSSWSWSWDQKSCLRFDEKVLVFALKNWSLGLGIDKKVCYASLKIICQISFLIRWVWNISNVHLLPLLLQIRHVHLEVPVVLVEMKNQMVPFHQVIHVVQAHPVLQYDQ